MAKPLLSIVVPTKDRYKYLKHLIKLIHSFNSDEIEIVVQDNTSDNDEILDFLSELNYSGCKYFHEAGQLPMSTNADKAILHSEGEYVCFLGDDDGICPNCLDYCRYMKENGYEAMRSNLAHYYWPDAVSSSNNSSGYLKYKYVDKELIGLSPNEVLMDVLNRGFVDRGNLPSVYHGIVTRTILNVIYDKCNTFFPGQSPDISNGIAVCLSVDKILMTSEVVTVSGASKYHGGLTKNMTKKYPMVSDMVWFRPGAEEIWDKRLPHVADGTVIWTESSIETLRNMGRDDIINMIDFEKVYIKFAVFSYPMRKYVYPLSKSPFLLRISANVLFAKRAFKAIIRILKEKFNIKESGVIAFKNLNNIEGCISALNNEK